MTTLNDSYLQIRAENLSSGTVAVALVKVPKVTDHQAPVLKTELAKVAPTHKGRMVLDMSEVQLLGSSGIGMLVQVRAACAAAKGQLVICGLSPEITETLRITNLLKMLNVKPSLKDALAAFS